jgi:hypothetical protein
MSRVPGRRLTAAQFDAVRPLTRITDKRAEVARLAMVDGQSLQGVADLHQTTRSYVSDAVRVIWEAYERFMESQRVASKGKQPLLPPGWEMVTLAAPSSLIAELRAMIAVAAEQEGVDAEPKKRPVGRPRTKDAAKAPEQ